MEFIQTRFNGAWLMRPKVFGDNRGFFLESYSEKVFADHGIDSRFVQDNHSRSVPVGVLRGLHFQKPPMTQAKLLRVIRGGVYDVIVDLRTGSPTYGEWEGFELSADNFNMVFVPRGFAHGFCTLLPETEILYKVDNFYSPEHDSGIRWDDPTLKVTWPTKDPVLSEKDKTLGLMSVFVSPFTYPQAPARS